MIPIYLIVAGAASLFANCCTCGVKYNQQENDGQTVNPLQAFVQFFLFAWFICGNVWIYTNYEPNYTDPSSLGYCHKTLYLFAFWATNFAYILHGFVLVCFCCLGTCTAAAGVAQVVQMCKDLKGDYFHADANNKQKTMNTKYSVFVVKMKD